MNVMLKVPPTPLTAKIAHSIMGYDRTTEELEVELPVPMFLDTLALKIAKVPSDDKFGILSYPLDTTAVDTFRFLLGLSVDSWNWDYFLESTAGSVPVPSQKFEALHLMTKLTPRPNYFRGVRPRVSERELVLPTLRLLTESNKGWMPTGKLISRLTKLFEPSGQDAAILAGRSDTYFSQKVRNMISHRNQPSSFIHQGLARYKRSGLEISDLGRSTVAALLS